jgi:hypothetical protein
MRRIERRTFINTVGLAAGSAVLLDPLLGPRAHAASKVVYSAYSDKLVSGSTPSGVQEQWVQAALDSCMRALSGKTDIGQAWEAVLPGITPQKKVAIKINCLKTQVSPQFATVKAVVSGLTAMFGGTYPAKNISLFDNDHGGTKDRMALVYGKQGIDKLGIVYKEPSPPYAGSTFQVKGKAFHPAALLAQADYGISLAPLKRHQIYAGGITGVIKNMMGACSTSTSSYGGGGTFHDKAPFNSFVDLFKNYMLNKLHLYIVDMLFAASSASPSGWAKVVKRITVGTDPCAVDAYVADVLKSVGISATKGVPQALAQAGLGNASYALNEPTVTLGSPPPSPPPEQDPDSGAPVADAGVPTAQPDGAPSVAPDSGSAVAGDQPSSAGGGLPASPDPGELVGGCTVASGSSEGTIPALTTAGLALARALSRGDPAD